MINSQKKLFNEHSKMMASVGAEPGNLYFFSQLIK